MSHLSKTILKLKEQDLLIIYPEGYTASSRSHSEVVGIKRRKLRPLPLLGPKGGVPRTPPDPSLVIKFKAGDLELMYRKK